MINYLLAVLLLLNFGCGRPEKSSEPAKAPDEVILIHNPEPLPVPPPVVAPIPPTSEVPPNRAETFKVNVSYGNITSAQRIKYEKAIVILKKVVASKEFSDRVLAFKYGGVSGFASSSRSPAYVLDNLLNGNETLHPEKDNELDLEVRFYYADTNIIGYTYLNVSYIYVNTKFFNQYLPSSVAANLAHEYMHKLGYGHDVAATARRPYSVPYAIGSIVRLIGEKL